MSRATPPRWSGCGRRHVQSGLVFADTDDRMLVGVHVSLTIPTCGRLSERKRYRVELMTLYRAYYGQPRRSALQVPLVFACR